MLIGTNTAAGDSLLQVKGTNISDAGDVTLRVDAGTVSSSSATNNAVLDLTARGKTSGGSALTQNCEIRSIGQTAAGGVLSFHIDDTGAALQERLRITSAGDMGLGNFEIKIVGISLTIEGSSNCAYELSDNGTLVLHCKVMIVLNL